MDSMDRPRIEMTLELAEEQERLKIAAALATFFWKELKAWDLPDQVSGDLCVAWLSGRLAANDEWEDS